jgi:hypothetical protein
MTRETENRNDLAVIFAKKSHAAGIGGMTVFVSGLI